MSERFYCTDNVYFLTDQDTIVHVERDDCTDSPRDWDNVGTLLLGDNSCLGKNEAGDMFPTWEGLLEHYGVEMSGHLGDDVRAVREAAKGLGDVVLPVSTYEHGGMEVYIGLPEDHFDGRWDCSFQGLIMADKETIRENWGEGPDAYETAENVLRGEIKDLDTWAQGEVYGYTEYNKMGEEIDACWGFYGDNPNENGISDSTGHIVEDLGEYLDIEECLEDNAERLGIEIDPLPSLSDRIHAAEGISEERNSAAAGVEKTERDDAR